MGERLREGSFVARAKFQRQTYLATACKGARSSRFKVHDSLEKESAIDL